MTRAALRDLRGAATVEYVIVLVLVSAGAALALVGLGALLLELFRFQQALLLLPFP
jgi:Flp pilus assembly pilin Flp